MALSKQEMQEIVKNFIGRIGEISTKQRLALIKSVRPIVENDDCPDAVVSIIIQSLGSILNNYLYGAVQAAVLDLLRISLQKHRKSSSAAMSKVLVKLAQAQKQLVCPSRSGSAQCLLALQWSILLTEACFLDDTTVRIDTENMEWRSLLTMQSLLYYGTCAFQDKVITQSATRKLRKLWKKIGSDATDLYFDALVKSDDGISCCCILGNLAGYDSSKFSKRKSQYLELYVKHVVMSKSRPLPGLLDSCGPALKQVTHEEFNSVLLPAIQKALLRTPENVLPTVTSILSQMSIDLSQHAMAMAKCLTPQVTSKTDHCREESVAAVLAMASQISDAGAMEQVIKHFFALLKGSEGKLTIAGQKIAVLDCIGKLSVCPVGKGQSAVALCKFVGENFASYLLQESFEGALIEALTSFSQWCSKFSGEIPTNLLDLFKKGPALKASTSAVRAGYLECMNNLFNSDTLLQAEMYLPALLQTVEKASGQSLQIPIVSEALSAAHLVAKLSLTEIKIADSKLNAFWTTTLDPKKRMFTSDKFLQQASEASLLRLAALTESLLLDHPTKMQGDKAKPFFAALVQLTLHKVWKVRSAALKSVRKLLQSLSGYSFCKSLLSQFSAVLQPCKVIDLEASDDAAEILKTYITPKRLEAALRCLLSLPEVEEDAEKATAIALKSLIDCYHPCIVNVNQGLWTDFLYNAHMDAREFIEKYADHIVENFVEPTEHTESHLKAISDLVRIAPHVLMPKILTVFTPRLDDSELYLSDSNYAIMQTPEGELWNKSIIESGPRIAENKNIKRENKAYSYKEQMEFLALEKEINAKKAAKAGGGGVKGLGGQQASQPLSKKQKELMQAEMEKEAEIREKALKLNKVVQATFAVLRACFDQPNVSSLARYVPKLVDLLLPLTDSRLASKLSQDLYVELRNAVKCDRLGDLGIQVAYVTLRMGDPVHALDANWCQEDLLYSIVRIASGLRNITRNGTLATPCFAYIYPFLAAILTEGRVFVNQDEKVMTFALELYLIHAKRTMDEDFDDDGPEFLPRQKMLAGMSELIDISTVKMQELAGKVFIATCEAIASLGSDSSEIKKELKEILDCLLSPNASLRKTALEGMIGMVALLPTSGSSDEMTKLLNRRLWVAKHDQEEECQKLADRIWTMLQFTAIDELCLTLIDDITNDEPLIQEAAAKALKSAMTEYDDAAEVVLTQLFNTYDTHLSVVPALYDELGRVLIEETTDAFQGRIGVAMALQHISPILPESEIPSLFSFFVPDALKDKNPEVRAKMLEAALQAVNDHGKSCTNDLMDVFEKFLGKAPDSESFDTVRQSVVILMGTLARHLDKTNPKVKPIVAKLTEALSTPSQPVQEAVAKCLPPLVPAIKEDAPSIVKKMLVILLESENYGERKGAAYGLAGMLKGLGIIAFKQLDIMTTLTEAIQDKKNYRHREGALFAFEMFCTMLGRLFEPYVVHVLPHLLICFGDGNQYVREAADDTAKAVMKNLSAHGVKLVLPSLLSALKEDSWRTKTGSVELLGAMAFCAPKQLSSCLPSVVPRLCEIITDSHPKVQKSGQQALKQIGSVIRNPEILSIAPVLLGALSDPFRKTSKCLQTLLDTKFVHFIDAPSLALIMPVVHRAFEDRSTDTRKMAAQIIGNMYSLTDQKDLKPYLQSVIPGLKNTLLDPVPEVRTVAAKALGSMVKGSGEELFEDLLPWLMETLTSEQSSVDRSGSAQGLAEVLAALGVAKLRKLMPQIVEMATSQEVQPHVRDGYIMLYIYLPGTFGEDFSSFIGDIIPALLTSLADECEFLRDTALMAGRRIISMYAQTAITLLLPQLEQGLFDDNWRIRLSSIQLLGDLLYHVSGVTGKMSAHGAEDDNFGTQEGHKAIQEVLGQERCHRVFSGLYIGRSDVALLVRQSALHVWKIVVPNTPRLLREILPTLFQLLLSCLASSSYDKRQVAARTLGDIVRKLGERMLPELIPILENGLQSDQPDQRQGVCIGLSEIIKSCSKDAILTFSDNLVPTVRRALCDPLPEVRKAAAVTFDNLHSAIGAQALEEILPHLLEDLGNPDISEYVVDGLRQIIAVKGKVVMPFIVPKLIQPPVNTKVLSFLSAVAGEALTRHLAKILKALLVALVNASSDDAAFAASLQDCTTVVLSVDGEHGTRIIMDDLMEATKSESIGTRRAAITLLHFFCKDTSCDYSEYVAVFIRGFFKLLADEDEIVQSQAWSALSAVTKKLDAADQLQHVGSVRQAIRFVRDDVESHGGVLPGFCLPKKGMSPVLPILREGILNGAPDMKEQAAKGLTECIRILTPAALKPSVVSITGPLIRILGDRFNFNVRVAVLETLTLLLGKAGIFLKPFLPQLQTTFSKALHDTNRPVRLQSAMALKHLVLIHARLDPLFTDLNNSVRTQEDPLIKETLLQALRGCISGAGAKISTGIRNEIVTTLTSLLGTEEETCRKCAAGCIGSLCGVLPPEDLKLILNKHILVKDSDASWPLRQGRSSALAVALKDAASKVYSDETRDVILSTISEYTSLDRVQIVSDGLHAATYLLVHCVKNEMSVPTEIVNSIKKGFVHTSNDVKVETNVSLSWAGHQINSSQVPDQGKENGHICLQMPEKMVAAFLSNLLTITKEKNTTVRSSAESAIVTMLALRQSEDALQKILPLLSSKDASAMTELMKTRLKKVIAGKESIEDIDDTLLTR